ncbi:hypothetical protein C482_11605 [Natrialba chahannaoensis JCM 10990]|uniref:Uncharacterized protein n=1 Tax=Natrialba chahannaoensis JCM 10990 TaxID=1227492 RepID=M0AK25_9EURY|nr:hypothetical protein [Natrialba chahannaoensis]ELY98721.1 hypothetical protein C482_11605 [Natrialba chahannaoensis JCM 10990]
MTDSTIDDNAGDGGVDVGGHGADLFGEMTDDVFDEPTVDGEGAGTGANDINDANDANESDGTDETEKTGGPDDTGSDTTSPSGDGVADQTAASVFGQLKGDDEAAVDDVLDDDSPDDIIASADEEPDEHPDDLEDLLADEGELEKLLLTGRTKEQEFLWVETGESVEDDERTVESGVESESEFGSKSEAGTGADSESGTPTDAEPEPDASATDESVDAHADAVDAPANSPRVADSGPITDQAADETSDERAVDESADSELAADVDVDAGAGSDHDRAAGTDTDVDVDTHTDTEANDETDADGVLTRLRATVGNLF